jgi:serine-type D-Ala-D-Ala carboxypeptidase (penicillin-binding protein 5/6)
MLGALAVVCLSGPWSAGAAAEERSVPPPVVSAPSAVLLDASSDQVLFERGGNVVRAPASMAKIMTMILAVQALQSGKVHARDLVAVSDDAYHTGGSQIWVEPGEVLPFGQLLMAVAVGSANDAAVAIAEHLSGSVPSFVAEMNAFAKKLGMAHTRFVNPNGLDSPGQPTETTALDMARLGAYAAGMPDLLRLTSTREDKSLRNGKGGHLWLVNTNKLIGTVAGVDGLKTGFTNAAGYCLAATAQRSGLRLVAVVMGAANSKARFADATALLNWGYAHYQAAFAVHRGERVASVPVRGGRTRDVALVAARDASFTLARGAQVAKITHTLSLPGVIAAPVRAGQVVGEATYMLPGTGTMRVPLVARANVPRVRPFDVLRRLVGLLPSTTRRGAAGGTG